MTKNKQIDITREELIECLKYAETCCATVRLALQNYDEKNKTFAIVWPPEPMPKPQRDTCIG